MRLNVLHDYFNWIQKNINTDGIMYCINRYIFTPGEDKCSIRDYNLDSKWKIIISQPTWLQTHLHELILQRCKIPMINPKFWLKSFPLRSPPPGPIM